MRIPLAVTLESRSGAVDKDAKVLNGLVEVKGEDMRVRLRPGLSDVGHLKGGTAWNPADKGSTVTLSNVNLTASCTGTNTMVRADRYKSTGKWYWEVTVGAVTAGLIVGIAKSGATLNNYLGQDANGWSYSGALGKKITGAVLTAYGAAFTTGDIIGVALDLDNGTLIFYKNGATQGTAFTGLSGTFYPAMSGSNPGTEAGTANFGNSSFSYSIPSGYTAMYTPSAQLLYPWNGIKAISGDYLIAGTLQTLTSAPTSTALNPTVPGQSYSAQDNGSNSTTPYLMLQNGLQAWSVNQAGTVAAVSLPAALGSHVISVTSLTRSGTVATALTAIDPPFDIGQSITIAGATPAGYNGAQVVTAVTPASYVPGATIPITITRSGTTATATSATPHGLTSGTYTISGANESAYNGSFAITVTSTTQFTYTVTVTGATTRTWNGADKDTTVTLSGGSLTATIAATASHLGAVRATAGKSSGKWYWEVTLSATTYFQTVCIGVANSSAALTAQLGSEVHSWSWYQGSISYHTGSGAFYGAGSFSTGDVIGVALDMDSKTLTFYKNGVSQGQAFSGLSGTLFPAISGTDAGVANAVTVSNVANFGATAFAYSVPAGFTAFEGTSPATPATGPSIITSAATAVPASFTFTIGGAPATPATGTITGSYSKSMVPGIGYLDGTFYLMDETGVIYNSTPAGDDPATYPALGFITAQNENGGGKRLGKSASYITAFKEWSTEYFYNAANDTGSPLLPVNNGFTQVGCASGASVVASGDTFFWVSQEREGGRGVYMLSGLQQQKISTPDIDRILNADDLATVYAESLNPDGHELYVLTLVSSNLTLVYDLSSKVWTQWSSLSVISLPVITLIFRVGTTATVVTSTPHGLSDGDPVLIAGADQPSYNGIFQVRVSTTSITLPGVGVVLPSMFFTVEVRDSPLTPATGSFLCATLLETYYKLVKHMSDGVQDLLLHISDGHLYLLNSQVDTDSSVPINCFMRTTRLDGGSNARKKMGSLRVIGDAIDTSIMVRSSDDDCQTFSAYRVVDLHSMDPKIRKLGGFRRRTIEARYISGQSLYRVGATQTAGLQLAALEVEISQ